MQNAGHGAVPAVQGPVLAEIGQKLFGDPARRGHAFADGIQRLILLQQDLGVAAQGFGDQTAGGGGIQPLGLIPRGQMAHKEHAGP